MNTDTPLTNTNDDKLGRTIFAQEIASGLVNSFADNHESIVLGINGNWGSGKSTLINFIINEVERLSKENGSEIITLRFNPWMFSGQKELQNIFLKEMFLKFEQNKGKLKEASKKIADFIGYLNWLKYVNSGVGEAVKDTKEFFEGLAKEKDSAELKKGVDDLLIKSKVKLYITIDDIDRLMPSEIADIFQLVKLNGNFANTIFILAYDQDVVVSALKNQFGENGRKYIEKIVQIDYTLPSVSKQNIERIFIDSLIALFPKGKLQEELIAITDNIKRTKLISNFTSLRDIYRYNNSVKLRLPSIYNDLNIIDFLLAESVRIFDYKTYDFIIENKESLVYKKDESSAGVTQKRVSTSDFISKATINNNNSKEILKNLFADMSPFGNHVKQEDLIREKRVANTNYFDRYFNLQLSSLDIQEAVFNRFIKDSLTQQKLEILNELVKEEKIFSFLNWVEIKSAQANKSEIEDIIFASLLFTDSIEYKKEFFWGFDSEFLTVLRFCSIMLRRLSSIEKRRKLIFRQISNSEKDFAFSSFYIADNIIYAKQLLDEKKLSYDHLWQALFSENIEDDNNFIEDVEKLKKTSSKALFEKELQAKAHLNEDELTFILLFIKDNYSDFYDKNFYTLIANDNDLIKYLWMSIKRSYMSSSDGFGYQVAKYQFFSGMDVEEIKLRIDKINKQKLNTDENLITKLFLKAYHDGFQDKRFYNIQTLEVMMKDFS